MNYQAIFKPSFFKDLKKVPQSVRDQLQIVVDCLLKDPFTVINVKKLSGYGGLYRYRIGDYRLVYYIQPPLKKIIFLMLVHRKDVYRFLRKSGVH